MAKVLKEALRQAAEVAEDLLGLKSSPPQSRIRERRWDPGYPLEAGRPHEPKGSGAPLPHQRRA